MSDYIFSYAPQPAGHLSNALAWIYENSLPAVTEFHGDWGSLAVSQGHYSGFKPYENEQHLLVVIGGPVLYFRDNRFLVEEDSSVGTHAIYSRWLVEGKIQWDEDLSGPFTLLLIDKMQKQLQVITDLMSFIPVYCCDNTQQLCLGTHLDALALASGESESYDQVSLADFVLNDVVTYPYTAYSAIRQLPPASTVLFDDNQQKSASVYWEPQERNPYASLDDAAKALREGIQGYVQRVTEPMSQVAQFVSAGEDSRALSGLLPSRLSRDAYVFLDHMNREGEIAQQVATIYDAKFIAGYRAKSHYLDILPEASRLVGTGHQYIHAHSLHFDKKYKLAEYPAVFGGYLSDSLLKAAYTRKVRGMGRFPFLPEVFVPGETRTKAINHAAFNGNVLQEITKRRCEYFAKVKAQRPVTAHEWFVLRPATMRVAIPNLYTTRRLFKSYEPFMCKEAVKISAAVPTGWKLNRRLFNRAMKPFLKPSQWLLHADGRLPYFSWWMNMPIQFSIWLYRHIAKRIGLIKGNQGPWCDWQAVFEDECWKKTIKEYTSHSNQLEFIKNGQSIEKLLLSESLTKTQKVNLLQVLYSTKRGAK